jgi:hypothetical protein
VAVSWWFDVSALQVFDGGVEKDTTTESSSAGSAGCIESMDRALPRPVADSFRSRAARQPVHSRRVIE